MRDLKIYPDINVKVGDAEDLEYTDNYFDLTYCFHSTWYFSNLKKAIAEMIMVTCHGCPIIFDIQNCNNQEIKSLYKNRLNKRKGVGRFKRYFKNVAKIILRRGFSDWHFVVHEIPTYPQDVYGYLNNAITPILFKFMLEKKTII